MTVVEAELEHLEHLQDYRRIRVRTPYVQRGRSVPSVPNSGGHLLAPHRRAARGPRYQGRQPTERGTSGAGRPGAEVRRTHEAGMIEPRARLWLLHFPDLPSLTIALEPALCISGRCRRFQHPRLSDGNCTVRDDLAHVYGFMHALPDDSRARCSTFDEVDGEDSTAR